jgi:FixJ family two-component response regulator
VETYRANIMFKLQASSLSEVVRITLMAEAGF